MARFVPVAPVPSCVVGWCQEFGAEVCAGCGDPMTPASDHCVCTRCQTVCTGKFEACEQVWARGAATVSVTRPDAPQVDVALADARPSVTQSEPERFDPAVAEPVADLVRALPGRIAGELAQNAERQQEVLLAATERLAAVLARRICSDIARSQQEVVAELTVAIGALGDSVRAQRARLDDLAEAVEVLAGPPMGHSQPSGSAGAAS